MGINFQDVAYTYNEHKKKKKNEYVIEDVNLNISDSGEIITILGHTGSGKSTLVQMMNGLLYPTIGNIFVNEHMFNHKKHDNMKKIRQNVGLVFQFPEYQLFEDTIIKDVSFGPKNFGLDNPVERSINALKLFNLGEDFYEKNPYLISGGQMRKVAISGILASDPKILILDEPTVGLDPSSKKDLINTLKRINKEEGKTIILVTHDMNVVWDIATRCLVIDGSKIIYDGSKYDLFKDKEFLNKHSLDEPDIIKLVKGLNKKLGLDINPYQEDINSLYLDIKKVIS